MIKMETNTLIIGACTALSGAVVYLFKLVISLTKEQAEVTRRHSEKFAELSNQIGEYKGRQEGIQKLSEEVLQTVHKAINNENEKK